MRFLGTLRGNYPRCFNFYKKFRAHTFFIAGLFFLFFLIGFIWPVFFREEIISFIKQLSLSLEDLNTFQLINYIFFNNLQASFFAVVLGIGFGIFPLITGAVNGYLIGFVSRAAVSQEGIFILWRLLPHGVFELPAIILSMAIGLKIGLDLFRKNRGELLKENYIEGMRFFIFVIIPLLLVAGIIEGILVGLGA